MTWMDSSVIGGLSRLWPSGQMLERSAAEVLIAASHRRSSLIRLAFIIIVIMPTFFSAAYYLLLASPRYVSEAQFLVRGISSKPANGLDLLFRTFGLSRAVDDSNIVENYILSRDAVRALQAKLPLREIFARPEGDMMARFPRFWEKDNFERLFKFYRQRVFLINDTAKGIVTLRVISFRPEDSLKIARVLLSLAEDLANRMNTRAQTDLVASAQGEVDQAAGKVLAAQVTLTDFRNRALLVDPSKKSDSELLTIGDLSTELTHTLTQINESSITAPATPSLNVWRAKADALRERITAEQAHVSGAGEELGAKVSQYESLTLTRDLADKSLAAAIDSLERARQDARRQQIYVEEIATPNLADESTEPQSWRMIATVFIFAFAAFGFLWILSVGAQEHQQ
ncbi:MAG: hypothetical protein FWD08_05275 [Alphaproteobacteria bacterium]|nr:hypothetical protein [Alphaproteobacteria bacterium]